MPYFWTGVFILVVLFFITITVARRITVYEFEKGIKYCHGKFVTVLGPGQHWFMPYFTRIDKTDVRPRFVTIPGQEVLTSDSVTIKISLAANYEIADVNTAINKVQNYAASLYLELQLALREIVGGASIDDVLEKRAEFGGRLMELTKDKAAALGVRLLDVNIKDIMFPGTLKQTFSQVAAARKEGQAALERARGESAALRNLANAAKMLDNNPNLLQLRLLQTVGESSGNTVVLGSLPEVVVPKKPKK